MWKSTVIAGWRSEGKRDLLVKMVQKRYPTLAAELLDVIKESTDENAIERWSLALLTTSDQAAFEAAITNGASQVKPAG